MTIHPSLREGNVAVITGGADGIGLATARRLAGLGMRVCLADIQADKLNAAAQTIDDALAIPIDVSDRAQVLALRDQVYDRWGQVDVLMNNAGIGRRTHSWSNYADWQATLNVNLWGVINGVQAFTARMVAQGTPGLIVNTGSKQGITMPPGNPAYNVSKAALKALTEALQHDLRNTEGCQITAHLLVPGFTYTGMIRSFLDTKPEGAWTSEQVTDFLIESVTRGDFYILCPDNDVDRETDNKRMAWTMGDLIHNRPPLSRWHPDYADRFKAFLAGDDDANH